MAAVEASAPARAGRGAQRYASAIFELAQEEGQVARWTDRLAAVRDLFATPEVRAVIANPSIAAERRQDLAAAMLPREAGPEAANLARLLVAAGRVGDAAGIAAEFERFADEAAGRVRAVATTAIELTPAEERRLAGALAVRLGREVRLDLVVDPTILGGLIVQVGDHVTDASVAARLGQLRARLGGG